MKRFWVPVSLLALCIGICIFLMDRMKPDQIKILGHSCSPTLRGLYEKVRVLHGKPIKVIEITGGDNNINVHGPEIVLRLKQGSSEDNIAHELMHAILSAEGYPQMFAVGISPLATQLRNICSADLDHIIINNRLLELGYDARKGFLKKAATYNGFLQIQAPENPNAQVVLKFGILHELIKYHYYIGDSQAQTDILGRFPDVAKYWTTLSSSIDNLPEKPKPQDIWNIAVQYIATGDMICIDLNASIRISDLIGFGPIPLHTNQLTKPAKSNFTQTTEEAGNNRLLLRTFLISPRIMVDCEVIPTRLDRTKDIKNLNVKEFLKTRDISYVEVD